jgi:PAS domain S-box-containing protein
LGFERKELIGKWFPSTVVATDEKGKTMPAIERPITKSFMAGKTISAQCYYRKKDGTLLPVAINVSPVLLEGRPVGAIEVFRDITDELLVDRMKSEFISLASHQLRTPATAVKTYLSLLIDGFVGKLNERQLEFAEIAYNSNERQLQIVNDLLVVASTESHSLMLKKETVDLRGLVDDVVKQQIATIRKRKQDLKIDMPAKSVYHKVDPSFFRMVIDNLLSNASKYTPEGGKLHVELKRRKDRVEMAVSDNGVGIDPRDISRLFQKFSRIDNPLSAKVSGSGIGLYLLKQIVDLHDGKIDVESTKDQGTTFTVKLPA